MVLRFYEEVVVTACDSHPEFVGRTGYVLGIDQEPGAEPGYTVFFEDIGKCVDFSDSEVRSTGVVAERSRFYDDTQPPIRVRVIDGKGEIVE